MPHYRDGTEAKVGDRVRGTGYNAVSKGYDPEKGVEGIVIEVRPGSNAAGACTLTMTYLKTASPTEVYYGMAYAHMPSGPSVRFETEHGDTVGFEKIG